ncbi:MAG: hypothetical protein H6654_09325 [Ardenticatenaceae bacterium]|nr:hypothetical protein [Anaerolineales bacterium]MCB8938613.1 hypothetical protein [Ardenticatenaceae bacterium]MCB8973746.1 hypothetical protein [Ardenticatenaceae bacterium]
MHLAVNSMLVLWGIGLTMSVLFFWGILRFALSTCDADNMTHGLAQLFCFLLLLAGLALGFMVSNLPA